MDAFLFSLCFAFTAAAATAAHPPRPLRQLLTRAITGNLCSLMPSEGRIMGRSSATDGLRVPPINKSSCGAVYSSGHFLLRPLLLFPLFSAPLSPSFCPFLSPLSPFVPFPIHLSLLSSRFSLLFSSVLSAFPFSFLPSPRFLSSPLISFPFHSPLLSFVLYPLCPPFSFSSLSAPFVSFCSHLILSLLLYPLLPPPPLSYFLFTPRRSFFPPLLAGGRGRGVLLICPL